MYKTALPCKHTAELAYLLVGFEEGLGTRRFGLVGVFLDKFFQTGLGGGCLIELAEADTLFEVRTRRAG